YRREKVGEEGAGHAVGQIQWALRNLTRDLGRCRSQSSMDHTEVCHASKSIVMAGLDPAIHPSLE
ncbi:MAG TPA: hypothetical protein VFP38_22490, partial [Bradyrhizobium sp.]|nr:hypothetical protein [Bradyrhizobium sp.]